MITWWRSSCLRRLGDGWLNIYVPPENIQSALDTIQASAEKAGRDYSQIGLECWTGMGNTTPDEWHAVIETWQGFGATHITLNTAFNRGHIKPIESRDAQIHMQAMETYMDAVRGLFDE